MDVSEATALEAREAAALAVADDDWELQERSGCARLVRMVEMERARLGAGHGWQHPNMTVFEIAVGDHDDCRELARRPGGVGSRLSVAAYRGLLEQLHTMLAEAGWAQREDVLCSPWRVEWRTETTSGKTPEELRVAGLIVEVHVDRAQRACNWMPDWIHADTWDCFFVAAAGTASMRRDGSVEMRDDMEWTPQGSRWVESVLGLSLPAREAPAYDWHLSERGARWAKEKGIAERFLQGDAGGLTYAERFLDDDAGGLSL